MNDELERCRRERLVVEHALAETRHALRQTQQALARSRAREQSARAQGSRDVLTGLGNRLAFSERCDQALAQHASNGRGLCLLFVDLDGFKAVNDHWGHAAGDLLLRVVGERLVHALRRGDFVARHGGDEFVCLLPSVGTEAQALAVSQHLIAAIGAPCQLQGPTPVQVGASVGIALFPQHGDNLAALLQSADHAMLHAKATRSGTGLAGRPALRA